MQQITNCIMKLPDLVTAPLKYFSKGSPSPVVPIKSTIITECSPLWKLAVKQGPFVRLAGLSGAAAVILGAYGAHKAYPKDRVNELKPIYETGNKFHFYHSLALVALPLCRFPKVTAALFITGTFLFSGACYYHAFTGENKFNRFAPVGGTLLIIGWLSMVF
ncbi:transmembrane protein 256 homolog [Agrilus planipennis]|uniref:Transmembrane protein 256 homolog n=1 Tax=Agrilus planipennis TaxID=224129 RepID=A0A1W4X3D0_AGRPL|nr:transmembrane protein 256 homolog [Agrilus planipennis]